MQTVHRASADSTSGYVLEDGARTDGVRRVRGGLPVLSVQKVVAAFFFFLHSRIWEEVSTNNFPAALLFVCLFVCLFVSKWRSAFALHSLS